MYPFKHNRPVHIFIKDFVRQQVVKKHLAECVSNINNTGETHLEQRATLIVRCSADGRRFGQKLLVSNSLYNDETDRMRWQRFHNHNNNTVVASACSFLADFSDRKLGSWGKKPNSTRRASSHAQPVSRSNLHRENTLVRFPFTRRRVWFHTLGSTYFIHARGLRDGFLTFNPRRSGEKNNTTPTQNNSKLVRVLLLAI